MKLPLIKATTKVITYRTERYKLVDDLEYRIVLTDGKVHEHNRGSISCKFKECPFFDYVKDGAAFRDECKKHRFYDCVSETKRTMWYDSHVVENLYKEFAENEFNPDNLIAIKTYDHTFLDRFGKRLEMLVHSSYIGGFSQPNLNSDYDTRWRWKELVEHLRNHPLVSNLKEEDVPSYNSDFYGQKGLEFDCLYQTDWQPLGRMMSLSNSLRGTEEFDPLDVRQFDDRLIKKPSKKNKRS